MYQNNSCVALEDIGEGNDALVCMTNLTSCCKGENGPTLGKWYFPNETRIPSLNSQWEFYRNRGEKVVRLNRRRGGVEGIYRCEIPDSMNVTQTMYIIIGVFSADTGEWYMYTQLFCLKYHHQLFCLKYHQLFVSNIIILNEET